MCDCQNKTLIFCNDCNIPTMRACIDCLKKFRKVDIECPLPYILNKNDIQDMLKKSMVNEEKKI